MIRIAFIGAGSVVFTKDLLGDILAYPELHGCEVALHDVDAERLETAGLMARYTSQRLEAGARVSEHADRRAALEGADFVINMVQIGGHPATLVDFEIPAAHGLRQTIGDTLGIGGISRGLRTIPFMLDLARDMTALCPNALLLNYTNPMSILVWAVYRAFPELRVVGLCHSVQYTLEQVASYMAVAAEELVFECAGINHIAWFTRLERDGADAYPRLREAMGRSEVFERDPVRFELMRHLGYFVTESSEHNAEYTPYFLRDPELVDRFHVPVNEYLRRSAASLTEYADTRRALLEGAEFPLPEGSVEYGGPIIHSIVTGTPRVIHGNVRNTGLIPNLPVDACVEVPVLVDATGLRPCQVAALPPQLAGMCLPHVSVQELTVRAVLEGERDHVHHAAMLDRHAASVLSLEQIRAVVDELLEAHEDALPESLRPRRTSSSVAAHY